MADLSPETIELLERAHRAIEEAEGLRAQRLRLVARARQQSYLASAFPLRTGPGKVGPPLGFAIHWLLLPAFSERRYGQLLLRPARRRRTLPR
jgi:hypothetical protein